MQTLERTNNRVSSEFIELLIHERSKGRSFRDLGRIFNRSHEGVRQILAKYNPPQEPLLPEASVAAKLGYPVNWLARLRKDGIINPIRHGNSWLYSEEQVGQIPSLIAETRRCERCGRPRPLGYRKFCRECSQYRKKHAYRVMSPEEKARHIKRCLAWREKNPEKWKEISSRAKGKYRAKLT